MRFYLSALVLAGAARRASSRVLNDWSPAVSLENREVVRRLDLTGPYILEHETIRVKNIADSPQSEYVYASLPELVPHISVFEGKVLHNNALVIVRRAVGIHPDSGSVLSSITLPEPLEPNAETTIVLSKAYTDILKPLPEYGEQYSDQSLVYNGTQVYHSVYRTLDQVTHIKALPTRKEELDPSTLESSDARDTYGPFADIAPFSFRPLMIRYHYPQPLVTCTRLERSVWVSHWGSSVSFEESYWLKNVGTKLKRYSRVDFLKAPQSFLNAAAVRDFAIKIDPRARDLYYVDLVGNVSTSHFRREEGFSLLEMRPRYPVFGGWNYNFTIGWSVDLSAYTNRVSNRYTVRIPQIEGPDAIWYGKVNVSVILPEGASDIKAASTMPGKRHEDSLVYSFLDAKGRPKVTFEYTNLITGHKRGVIEVEYTYSLYNAMRKPLTVASGIFAFMLAILGLIKLDLVSAH